MADQSTFEDLLIDEDDLNEDLLVETVGKYVKIGKDSGNLHPEGPYEDLTAARKIVVALLAQKARFELDLADAEWLGPSEISELTGVKKGTVYPKVRELENMNIIRGDDGQYKLPPVNVERAKEYLEGDE